MTQREYISNLSKDNPDAFIVGSLGSISHDLEETKHERRFCIKGAMGCVMGIGLGLALSQFRKVIVVIGDGSFLMKQGSLSTILAYAPKNFELIILNNNKYASCGGQKTNFKFIKKYLPPQVKIHEIIC